MLRTKPLSKNMYHVKRYKINYICSVFLSLKIKTTQDLISNFNSLIERIYENPGIFKTHYTDKQCYNILKESIYTYNLVNEYTIALNEETYINKISYIYINKKTNNNFRLTSIDDLFRVTKNYDRFSASELKIDNINKAILRVIDKLEFTMFTSIIVGSGDTGTTLWLEQYKTYHGKINDKLSLNQLPNIVMISNGSGSWKHNYTLAQPQSTLERTTAKSNPCDYMSSAHYLKNPHANARHVYQANQVSLAKTEAPYLNASVQKIETKNIHLADWDVPEANYRLKISTHNKLKQIYSNDINICTGLGPARNILIDTFLSKEKFELLNKFDHQKQFTPIVDGNQFILTGTEEGKNKYRSIVIYGGGGTAAACYRKGFFGHDLRTENRPFSNEEKINSVLWIARQFNKAGTGKLATSALKAAHERKELLQGDLLKIDITEENKISITFKNLDQEFNSHPFETLSIVCDQFVYSIGQDDNLMRQVCEEIDVDLKFNYDQDGMLLNISTADNRVKYFGAAAMAVKEKDYMEATSAWLKKQHIGGDVGPGSMPPSRAQIKRYNSLNGFPPESINVNIDSHTLIKEYLCKGGIDEIIALYFVIELLHARKLGTSGCSHEMLKAMLNKYMLNRYIDIHGHTHIMMKTQDNEVNHKYKPLKIHDCMHSFYHKNNPINIQKKKPTKVTAGFFDKIKITQKDDDNSYISIDLPLDQTSNSNQSSDDTIMMKPKVKNT